MDVFSSMFCDRCFTIDIFALNYRFYVVDNYIGVKDRVRDDDSTSTRPGKTYFILRT